MSIECPESNETNIPTAVYSNVRMKKVWLSENITVERDVKTSQRHIGISSEVASQ